MRWFTQEMERFSTGIYACSSFVLLQIQGGLESINSRFEIDKTRRQSMAVLERRCVLVGIRMDDSNSRQLLNWALVKVAEPGDCVIAVHVVTNPDYVSKGRPLVDGYLEVYEGLCNVKKLGLSGQIFTGNSVRNILVREAKNHAALALVLGGRASTAKYCAKRLPPTTDVLAIQGSRVIFRRCTNKQLPAGGLTEDPRPSLTSIVLQSELGDSAVESEKSTCEDTRELKEEAFEGTQWYKRVLSRSVSQFASDPTAKNKLGWPFLRRACSKMSQIHHVNANANARDMSVVQWVMSLPDGSPQKSSTTDQDNLSQRSIIDDFDNESYDNRSSSTPSVELPNELALQLQGISYLDSLRNCKCFSLEVLNSCTCHFSLDNLIGKGGSNHVYKGILPDGRPIAVKILQSSTEALKDFTREVEIISSLNHKGITPLLGICMEDSVLFSVYDYYPNGSLEENLHGKKKDGHFLSWEVRFNVAVGIAEALNYLHNETSKPVIHRDVKSSNILLSHGFEPQLSDFGFAIWGPTTSSFLTQEDLVGTFGYLAPEYFMYGKLRDLQRTGGLVVWAKPILENGDVEGLVDPNLQGKFDVAQMQKMVLAASLCITRAARLRPRLNQVLKILKGDEEVENLFNSQENDYDRVENEENIDDEVYPNSSAELHLMSLALLDLDGDAISYIQ